MLRGVRLDEALGELGLSKTADAADVRKAYLRLLKSRKPELDPEGFMRLREAFELVNGLARVGVLGAMAKAEGSPANDEVDSTVHVNTEQPSTIREARAEEAPPSEPVVTQEPAPAAPDEAPEGSEKAEAATEEPQPSSPSWSISLDQPKEAAATLCDMLAYAKAGHDVPPQLPFLTMEVLLRLHLTGSLKTARSLMDAFEEWLSVTANEIRFPPVMAVRWAMLRELWAVRHELPLEVRAPIARGIASGDFKATRRELARFRVLEPDSAERAAIALRVHASVLAPRVASALQRVVENDPPAPVQRRSGRSPWWLVFVAVQVLMALGRCASQTSSIGASPGTYQARPPTPTFQAVDADFTLPPLVKTVVRQAEDVKRPDIAMYAREVGKALAIDDCAGVSLNMALLATAQYSSSVPTPPILDTAVRDMERFVADRCPSRPTTPFEDKR